MINLPSSMASGIARVASLGLATVVVGALTVVTPAVQAGSTKEADLVGSPANMFMGNAKVQMGSRANGSFGSDVPAPDAGVRYFPREGDYADVSLMGFRSNPDSCGWADPRGVGEQEQGGGQGRNRRLCDGLGHPDQRDLYGSGDELQYCQGVRLLGRGLLVESPSDVRGPASARRRADQLNPWPA